MEKIILLACVFLTPFLLSQEEKSKTEIKNSGNPFFGISDGKAKRDAPPPDYEIVFDFNKTTHPESKRLEIDVGSKTTLKISASSSYELNLILDSELERYASEHNKGRTQTSNGGIYKYGINHELLLFIRKQGIYKIVVVDKNKSKPVEIVIDARKGNYNFENHLAELGFESFLENNITFESIKRKFGNPKYRTQKFDDGMFVAEYQFEEYFVFYSLKFVNGKLVDHKRQPHQE